MIDIREPLTEIDIDKVQNIGELRDIINGWFKTQDPKQRGFEKKVKQIQYMQRFFLKIKNKKNNINNLTTINKPNKKILKVSVGTNSPREDEYEDHHESEQ